MREAWAVDPLTRKVYEHSVTALLQLHDGTSAPLLDSLSAEQAERALDDLPDNLKQRLNALSPEQYLADIHAPLIVLLHDRDDVVIPVAESRRLRDMLHGRAGVRYTEFTVFKHLDPTKRKPPIMALTRELARFFMAMYPLFAATSSVRSRSSLGADRTLHGARQPDSSGRAAAARARHQDRWPSTGPSAGTAGSH